MYYIALFTKVFYANIFGSYDYIVVGSGPGGGTLAVELARNNFSTLLLEAGSLVRNTNITVPGLFPKSVEDESTLFEYYVKHYKGSNKTFLYPRAGALGGCSVNNAMISIYPNKQDFDDMKRITGDESWNEQNMRKYFIKMEKNHYSFEDPSHGYNGFYDTNYFDVKKLNDYEPKLIELLVRNIGNPLFDVNGPFFEKNGADVEERVKIPLNIDRKYERSDFVQHILKASTIYPLTISVDTFVKKVIFKLNGTETPKAIGVEYCKGEHLYLASPLSHKTKIENCGIVFAKKEVIISAGAFNTPQLLLLSGIGSRKELAKHNIGALVDLPGVGMNLQDKYEIPIITEFNMNFKILEKCLIVNNSITINNNTCMKQYQKYRKGLYTGNGVLSAYIDKSNKAFKTPDFITANILGEFKRYNSGWSSNVYGKSNKFTSLIMKARTNNKSGYVKLKNSNPFVPAIINFNYFGTKFNNNSDLDSIIRQIKRHRKRLNTVSQSKEYLPGKSITTEEDLKKYIIENVWGHNACCTSKMSNIDSDKYAVVDKNFKVHKVENLRVVDASIFPNTPAFFPVVFTHMIALKAADDIIKSNGEGK